MSLSIGQRIVGTGTTNTGKTGYIAGVCDNEYVVAYDDGTFGHGTNYKAITSTNNTPMIKTVSNMMKKLLDADTQALVKAGYINGDLEMTNIGLKALQTILFVANKAALVESAKADIAEAEATKTN